MFLRPNRSEDQSTIVDKEEETQNPKPQPLAASQISNNVNSDDGINYALMETANVEADNVELKSLHVSFRDQTLENNRIKIENSVQKKRNDYLESELFSMLEIQTERDNAVYVKEKLLEEHAYLEKELAKEREAIKLWTNSGKTTQKILENGCWGSGYSARSNSDKTS
ncbi:hypothetical protein AgCh_012888 [Apium graveolens]